MAKPKAKAAASATAKANIDLSHERSRSQFLCRSDIPEYPRKSFKYDGTPKGEEKALQTAKKWCRDMCKTLKLPCPEKFK